MGRARGSAVAVGRPIALELSSGAAMGQKSLRDLLRGLSVLTLCSSPHFLRFAPWILEGSRRLLGRHLWVAALRASFYGHFVGGETPAEVKAAVGQLRAMGLRALLALPCEEQRRGRPTGEEWFEANCGAALQCVGLTAAMGQEPMMQLKVTALMSAQLCEILSKPNSGLTMEVVEAMMDGEERPLPGLSAAQNEHLRAAVGRLQRVTERAASLGVRVLVDAEQSALNPTLSLLTVALMGRHNRHWPCVWNTYQAYLRGCGSRLWADSEWLRRRGALFGAKLVRGAYVEEEKGGENLQPSLEWTHRSFGRCVELALALALRSRLRGAVMVATHNEDSVRHTARRMEELGIPRSGGGVCFGQLYGMGDHISLALGDAGFTVYKSVPYGPPEATIAYLVRRAQENHAAFSGAGKEAKLMARELWRRLQPWRR
ncbi:hydroxyproline dehydrogenase isoform X1 [Cuculus canorus]|uniref:hydroxyproline dehydrogenase isoform X1 n=1 Tax=Cuculus canorus TaxID=55661 RepID=UPI0023AAFAA8|nr:hydroxyproline dehydrogenase isoform X1 [Cuculus canorus]